MIRLHPCSECDRHVRADEAACPFCSAVLSAPAPLPPRPRGRLARAAIFAGATALASACGNGGTEEEPVDMESDVTAGDETAGPGDEIVADDPADEGYVEPQEPEPVPHPMPYGAPPARERLV